MKELEGNPYREKSRKLLFCNTSTAICNTSIGEYSEVTLSNNNFFLNKMLKLKKIRNVEIEIYHLIINNENITKQNMIKNAFNSDICF